MTPPRLLAALLLIASLAFASACDGSGGDETPTPASPTRAPDEGTATPPPGDAGAIREVDLREVADVQALLADTGGDFAQEDVLYLDLTEDGIDEAVVPVASGGTLGDIAFIVLTPEGDGTRTLLEGKPGVAGGMEVTVEDGKLVQVEPVPGPDDPECCPSMLRKTIYSWNGAALAIESVTTVPNPDGGVKSTPAAGAGQ